MTFDPHAEFEKDCYRGCFDQITRYKFSHLSTNPYCLTFEAYRDKLKSLGLIDKDKNSPGKCWLRSLFPDREDEV